MESGWDARAESRRCADSRASARASGESDARETNVAPTSTTPTITVPMTRESLRGETIITRVRYKQDHGGNVIHDHSYYDTGDASTVVGPASGIRSNPRSSSDASS